MLPACPRATPHTVPLASSCHLSPSSPGTCEKTAGELAPVPEQECSQPWRKTPTPSSFPEKSRKPWELCPQPPILSNAPHTPISLPIFLLRCTLNIFFFFNRPNPVSQGPSLPPQGSSAPAEVSGEGWGGPAVRPRLCAAFSRVGDEPADLCRQRGLCRGKKDKCSTPGITGGKKYNPPTYGLMGSGLPKRPGPRGVCLVFSLGGSGWKGESSWGNREKTRKAARRGLTRRGEKRRVAELRNTDKSREFSIPPCDSNLSCRTVCLLCPPSLRALLSAMLLRNQARSGFFLKVLSKLLSWHQSRVCLR